MGNNYQYFLTINNPTYPDILSVRYALTDSETYLHFVVGREGFSVHQYGFGGVRPRTRHLQICMMFRKSTPWKTVKNLFPRAHVESIKYDYLLAAAYCKKEGDFDESGDLQLAYNAYNERVAKRLKVADEKGDKGVVNVTPPSPSSAVVPTIGCPELEFPGSEDYVSDPSVKPQIDYQQIFYNPDSRGVDK
jgi:hypothetical protein